jgi:hypothetical protein
MKLITIFALALMLSGRAYGQQNVVVSGPQTPPTGVTVLPANSTIAVLTSQVFSAVLNPSLVLVTNQCQWTSSNPTVASNNNESFKALSSGATTVTCSVGSGFECGGSPCTGTTTLTVAPSPLVNNPACGVPPCAIPVQGTQGLVYPGFTFGCSGGTGPYTWLVSSGSLPGAFTLSSGGVLSGTNAEVAGVTTFSVTCTDSGSNVSSPLSVQLTVNAAAACGPPNYLCATQGVQIAPAVVAPSLGGLISSNAVITDSTLSGAKIFRASDGNFQTGSNANVTYVTECGGSADDFQFSVNKTFILIGDNRGFYFLRGLDFTNHKSFPLYPQINGVAQTKANYLVAGCGEWSYNNNFWFYDHGSQSGTVFTRTDVTNYQTPTVGNPAAGPVTTTVADFANALPGTPFQCGSNGGIVSTSDGTTINWVAVTKFNSAWVGTPMIINGQNTNVASFISTTQITVAPAVTPATNVTYQRGGIGPDPVCWHSMGGMDHNDSLNSLSFHMAEGYSTTAGQDTGCIVGDTLLNGQNPTPTTNQYWTYNTCTGAVLKYQFSGGSWTQSTVGTISIADRFTIHNVKYHGGNYITVTRVPSGCITSCAATYYFWQITTANVAACISCTGHEVEGIDLFVGQKSPAGQMFNYGSNPYATPSAASTNLLGFPSPWAGKICLGTSYPYSNMPCRAGGSIMDSHVNWSTNPGPGGSVDTGAIMYMTTPQGDTALKYPLGWGEVSISGSVATLQIGNSFTSNEVNVPIALGPATCTVTAFTSATQITFGSCTGGTPSGTTNYFIQAFPGCCYSEGQLLIAQNPNGPNYREYHTFNSGYSPFFNTQQGLAVMSLDGTGAMFSSDWMGTLGTNIGAATGYMPADWSASGTVLANGLLWPQTNNNSGYIFQATGNCTTGASKPTFPQTAGLTVTDGTCTWTNIGQPRGDVFVAILQ